MKKSKKNPEKIVKDLLEAIGENPEREGLVGTPERVVRMWEEIFAGYVSAPPKITIFKNGADGLVTDQMITDKGSFYSHCEHHMLPFFGTYQFAYIPSPNGGIIGISKVARIVAYHAAKLQIQERLVSEVVQTIWDALTREGMDAPLGVALTMEGEHLCKSMRGVKIKGTMTTTSFKGVFLTDDNVRNEFLNKF